MFTKVLKFSISFALPMEYTMVPDYEIMADSLIIAAKTILRIF